MTHRIAWPAAVSLSLITIFGGTVQGQLQSGGVQTFNSPYGGSMRFLRLPQVEAELELIDKQKEQIKDLSQQISQKMREVYQDLSDLPAAERSKAYREQLAKMADDVEVEVKKILLPHQLTRLKEVSLQISLGSFGQSGLNSVAEELEITEEQRRQLAEKRREMYKELAAKYRQLQQEAEQKLLEEVLTKQQREKLKKLTGEPLKAPRP